MTGKSIRMTAMMVASLAASISSVGLATPVSAAGTGATSTNSGQPACASALVATVQAAAGTQGARGGYSLFCGRR